MCEGDDDAKPGADEGAELVLGLREPAGSDRRPLGLERERLSTREGIELGCAFERLRRELFLLPDRPHLVRLPDEVRRAGERRDEVVRNGDRVVLVGGERRLIEIGAPLRGRIDDGRVDGMERSLRERGEGTDRLDLVAEELDPERLAAGRREDVDDPTADCELPTFLGALDTLIPREREALGQVIGVIG